MNLEKNNIIVTKNIQKYFDHFHALKNISVDVKQGEIVVILGPSGSGKSTFIRTLNGLETIDQGEIIVNGIDVKNDHYHNQLRKDVGMVFQSFNLFPHLTILENMILAPQKIHQWSQEKSKKLAFEFLERVGVQDQINKYPSELSGGQQQRAAIARSLIMQPKIMLFDEPTSSLDPEMIFEVLEVLKELAQTGITMLIVTHEIGFAKKVADRIFFFHDGSIIENSESTQFFNNPIDPRCQQFLNRVLSY